jgi:hypothetical protein
MGLQLAFRAQWRKRRYRCAPSWVKQRPPAIKARAKINVNNQLILKKIDDLPKVR